MQAPGLQALEPRRSLPARPPSNQSWMTSPTRLCSSLRPLRLRQASPLSSPRPPHQQHPCLMAPARPWPQSPPRPRLRPSTPQRTSKCWNSSPARPGRPGAAEGAEALLPLQSLGAPGDRGAGPQGPTITGAGAGPPAGGGAGAADLGAGAKPMAMLLRPSLQQSQQMDLQPQSRSPKSHSCLLHLGSLEAG